MFEGKKYKVSAPGNTIIVTRLNDGATARLNGDAAVKFVCDFKDASADYDRVCDMSPATPVFDDWVNRLCATLVFIGKDQAPPISADKSSGSSSPPQDISTAGYGVATEEQYTAYMDELSVRYAHELGQVMKRIGDDVARRSNCTPAQIVQLRTFMADKLVEQLSALIPLLVAQEASLCAPADIQAFANQCQNALRGDL